MLFPGRASGPLVTFEYGTKYRAREKDSGTATFALRLTKCPSNGRSVDRMRAKVRPAPKEAPGALVTGYEVAEGIVTKQQIKVGHPGQCSIACAQSGSGSEILHRPRRRQETAEQHRHCATASTCFKAAMICAVVGLLLPTSSPSLASRTPTQFWADVAEQVRKIYAIHLIVLSSCNHSTEET